MPDLRLAGAALAAVLVGIAVFLFRYLTYVGFTNDHFLHVARAQQMLLGGWPVRDFVDPGMPLMYVISAAGLLVDHSMLPEAIITFTALAAAAAMVTWLAWRSHAGLLMALVAGGLLAISGPRSYSYPKLLVYAVAIALCWRLVERPVAGRAVTLGAFIAAAFLLRHDHGVFVAIAALLAVAGSVAVSWRARTRLLAVVAATAVLLLVPWAIYVQSTLGLSRYVRSAVAFSRAEGGRTRLVSLPGFRLDAAQPLWVWDTAPPGRIIHVRWVPGLSDTDIVAHERSLGLQRVQNDEGRTWQYRPDVRRLDELARDPAVEDTDGVEAARPRWWPPDVHASRWLGWPGGGFNLAANAQALLFYVFALLPLAILLSSWRGWTLDTTPGARTKVAVVAVLALLLDAAFLRDPLQARLPDVIVPQALLLAWTFALAFRRTATPTRRRVLRSAAVGVLLLITTLAVGAAGGLPEDINRVGRVRPATLVRDLAEMTSILHQPFDVARLPSDTSAALLPVVTYLNACLAPGDRFSYIGFAPELYFYASRGFGGGQATWIGGYYSSDEEQRLTRDRLLRERVPIIIMPASQADSFTHQFPIVAAHIGRRYEQVGEADLSDGARALLLADRTIPRRGTYGTAGWPCFQ